MNYRYLKKRELNQRNETFSLFHFVIGNIKWRKDKIDTIVKINRYGYEISF